jgi:hypothetical protein
MRNRRFTSVVGLAALIAATVVSGAAANPLLSGYSGPGQGSQAILGSALLNTPSSGGGQGGAATPTLAAPTPSAPATPSSRGKSRRGRAAAPAKTTRSTSTASPRASTTTGPVDRKAADSGSGALGLSASELLAALAALAMIALLAVCTRKLAASGRSGTDGAKGISPIVRVDE